MRPVWILGALLLTLAPASALATLDAFLGTIGAGAPLSPEEEAARLSPGD